MSKASIPIEFSVKVDSAALERIVGQPVLGLDRERAGIVTAARMVDGRPEFRTLIDASAMPPQPVELSAGYALGHDSERPVMRGDREHWSARLRRGFLAGYTLGPLPSRLQALVEAQAAAESQAAKDMLLELSQRHEAEHLAAIANGATLQISRAYMLDLPLLEVVPRKSRPRRNGARRSRQVRSDRARARRRVEEREARADARVRSQVLPRLRGAGVQTGVVDDAAVGRE